MGKIEKILKKGPVEGQTTEVYPVTSTKAVYDENNKRLDNIITGLQESVYLNTPIPISTRNTTESMAQNVKNIADYVEKAKAAGMADVNGMAVTCLIDNNYSGVGYLYREDIICGIKTYDNLVTSYNFAVLSDGLYIKNQFIVKGTTGLVTSNMLAEGARKPIIITPDTTEVDEETYQKLLSDDVDVVFKDYITIGHLGEVFVDGIEDDGVYLSIIFYNVSGTPDTTDAFDYNFTTFIVSISKEAPHTVSVEFGKYGLDTILNTSGYLNKSTLSPVLQEIDLTGTDAERKAKLDQFETDWKALTGASDLAGARFVGITSNEYVGVFTWSQPEASFVAVATYAHSPATIYLDRYSGQLTEVPLSSHLEPVEIFDDNSIESKKKNIDNIEAYKSNLEKLGVDTSISFQVPIYRKFNLGVEESGFLIYSNLPGVYKPYSGLFLGVDGTSFNIFGISSTGEFIEQTYYLADINYSSLTTTSKRVLPAINEVNALAKGYSTIFTPIELTTETAQNKTAIDARVAAFTAQGISLTNGCCIPVVYKGVYAGNISLINGDWYGLLVKNTNNPADNINIKLSADGTITEGNSAQ